MLRSASDSKSGSVKCSATGYATVIVISSAFVTGLSFVTVTETAIDSVTATGSMLRSASD
jgi:hypothetical protein